MRKLKLLSFIILLSGCSASKRIVEKSYDDCRVISQVGTIELNKKKKEIKDFLESKFKFSFLLITQENRYEGSKDVYTTGYVKNDSIYYFKDGKYINSQKKILIDEDQFPKLNTMKSFICKDDVSSISYDYFVKQNSVIISLSSNVKLGSIPEKYKDHLELFNVFNVIKAQLKYRW